MTACRAVCAEKNLLGGEVEDERRVGILKSCHWETGQINQQRFLKTLNTKSSIDEILGLWFSDDMNLESLVFQNFLFLFVVYV